jgi:mannosyl-oligosaccharide glucosidase
VDRAYKAPWDQDEEDDEESRSQNNGDPKLQPPAELLTATPSRSFFPRGFYWDEGFHLLLLGAWDNDLSLEILKDWVDLIDEDGWVGREQILGEEARSKVPEEFRAQYPSNANPPTLTMAVTAFIERLLKAGTDGPRAEELGLGDTQKILGEIKGANPYDTSGKTNHRLVNREAAITYLRSIYPPLRRHYEWFRSTQRGKIKAYGRKARSRTEAYRWRGRSKDHVLTSGMDDYPRSPPHDGELHLDLISWMGFFTRTMRSIASFLGEKDDEKYFLDVETNVLGNLEGERFLAMD